MVPVAFLVSVSPAERTRSKNLCLPSFWRRLSSHHVSKSRNSWARGIEPPGSGVRGFGQEQAHPVRSLGELGAGLAGGWGVEVARACGVGLVGAHEPHKDARELEGEAVLDGGVLGAGERVGERDRPHSVEVGGRHFRRRGDGVGGEHEQAPGPELLTAARTCVGLAPGHRRSGL